ncbi:hypothetical protein FH039_11125 [Thermococcus indicus]|uniref:PIN domain-containing protein n=1 Tax=Thermococcus indicus TaxID=2586643 RepID=A0A4Y5SMD2_9EURY|nr:hypothetical protein [Thermococcus indicus]QDA32046.1 hypothetical protein FH039_11125 [Thermococcus indicus]
MANFVDTNIVVAKVVDTDPNHKLVEEFFKDSRMDIMESVYQELRQTFYEKAFSALTKLKKAISKANKMEFSSEEEEIRAIRELTIQICRETEPQILNFCEYIVKVAEERGLLLVRKRVKLLKEMNDFIIEQMSKIDRLSSTHRIVSFETEELESAIDIYDRVRERFKDDYDALIFSEAVMFSAKTDEPCTLYTLDRNFAGTARKVLEELRAENPEIKLQVVYLLDEIEKRAE